MIEQKIVFYEDKIYKVRVNFETLKYGCEECTEEEAKKLIQSGDYIF